MMTTDSTYAEKLGWPRGSKVLIFHVDDAGMSPESNTGTICALEEGIATSASVMMPCDARDEFLTYGLSKSEHDIGIHLTLTSEWSSHRWSPLSARTETPSLFDSEGMLWRTIDELTAYAKASHVLIEAKAQVERARSLGLYPTHIDSHMFSLLEHQEFLKLYAQLALHYKIPALIPAGHCKELERQWLQYDSGAPSISPVSCASIREYGTQLWDAGLPVVDDLHFESYYWTNFPPSVSKEALATYKIDCFTKMIEEMRPGIMVVLVHCTIPSPNFNSFTDSGLTRHGDLLAMVDPRLRDILAEQNVALTSWRELSYRRAQASAGVSYKA